MSEKILNLFDFDGTITKKSTVAPFFMKSSAWSAILRGGLPLVPAAISYVVGKKGFDEMLRRSTLALLTRKEEHLLAEIGALVADQLARDGRAWPQSVALYRECVARGEDVAIVTGGYGYVAKAWLLKMGLPGDVYCSRLGFDEEGRASHCEEVCVGAAKLGAVRVGRARGARIHAYGNSSGDYEMLSQADRAFWVGKDGAVSERPPQDFLLLARKRG